MDKPPVASRWLRPGVAAALVLCGLIPAAAHAQARPEPGVAGEPNVPEKAGKVLIARRVRTEPPRIDGVLDDPAWLDADSISDFVQWEPDNMELASRRTVLRVLFDDRYLYVGVQAYDDPDEVRGGLGRRGSPPPSDYVSLGFDPRHDHQSGYVFEVNASGVRTDLQFLDDDRSDSDYDAVWEARTARNAEGWSAEFRIPFSQMRFPNTGRLPPVWGFDARRSIHRRGEIAQWIGRPRGQRGQVSRWGHLLFEDALTPPRRLEVSPFGLARRAAPQDAASTHAMEVGADFRLGLGSAATLAGTVLPDFGQVEADPAVLNLSVFETFLQERRPFFLEDGNIFRPPYGLFRLFHSRRIGRRPGLLRVPGSESVLSRPEQTTLLGAAKVTGRGAGWTYGALTAVTAAEYAIVERPLDEEGEITEQARRLIEPRTAYSAARVQRDVGESSNIGWIGTAVLRDGAPDAFTGGIDYNLRWARNRWYLNGHWAGSRAPIAGEITTGFGGVSNIGYNAKHYNFWSHVDHFGRDFAINDIGFLFTRVDRTAVHGGLGLSQPDPWWAFRNVSGYFSTGRAWNGDGLTFENWNEAGMNARTRNFWDVNFGGGFGPERLDDLDTRGGPPIVRPAERWLWGFFGTDSRKRWRATTNPFYGWDVEGGSSLGLNFSLRLNPSARLQTSTGIGYRKNHTPAQWVTNRDVTGDGEIDHVYGVLDSRVVDITVRGTFAMHQDLTFELFAQPFVAVGNYSDFRRLARPSSYEFEPVELPFNPDFNRKSLRGNAVLRWEYRPGSTLFLVWSVTGADLTRPGEFRWRKDLADALSAPRDNVVMLKATYWLAW